MVGGMVGSNRINNVGWSAPSLFILGYYMQKRLGAATMLKFGVLSTCCIAGSWTVFSPNPEKRLLPNYRLINDKVPGTGDWDNISADQTYYMGTDQFVQSIFYFWLLSKKYNLLALGFMTFDICCYGPMTLGGPGSALVGAYLLL